MVKNRGHKYIKLCYCKCSFTFVIIDTGDFMLMWIALTMVIMFTFNSMIHSARDSTSFVNTVFFTFFSLALGLGYTIFCFRSGHIIPYLIGCFLAVPISQKLDKKE